MCAPPLVSHRPITLDSLARRHEAAAKDCMNAKQALVACTLQLPLIVPTTLYGFERFAVAARWNCASLYSNTALPGDLGTQPKYLTLLSGHPYFNINIFHPCLRFFQDRSSRYIFDLYDLLKAVVIRCARIMTAPSVYSLGDEVTSVNLAAYLRPLGKEVGSFGIRNRIWEVNSTVRNYFDSHLRPGILHHLNGLPESVSIRASINFTPYMIGRRSASATPTVLFTSDDEQLRKEARKLIKECGLLKEHRAWKTAHASKDPSWGGKLEQLAVGHESTGETHEASPVTRVLYDTTKPLRSKGMTLYVPHGPSLRAVTANLVRVKGQDYYLATAHTFFDRCSTPTPSSNELGDDFEIDSNGEESTVWDARIQIDLPLPEYDGASTCSSKSEPIESSSPEASDNENDSQSSLGSSARVNVGSAHSQFTLTRGLPLFWTHATKHGPSLYDIGEDEKDIQSTIEFIQKSAERKESQAEPANRQPATPSSNRLKLMGTLALWSTDKDWALIAIDSRNDPSLIAVLATDQEDLSTLQTISCKVPSGLILTHTSSGGRMTGTIMSTLSDYRVPYGKSFQEVFAIKLDGSLADGDCGSAVTDAATGALYGHIVAGCRTSGFAYVMAAHHVFPDLQASAEQDMHSSSSSVAPTTDTSNDASSGPSGLSSGKVANLVTADSSHIQTSSNDFSSGNDDKSEVQRQRWFEDAVKAKSGDMVKTYTKVVPLIIRWTETEEDIGRSHDEEVSPSVYTVY